MQIFFESRTVTSPGFREASIARIRFALRRLNGVVPRAKVQFFDVNGPRGGIDKKCQVELRTEGSTTVVIASLARDWRTALDQSLSRAIRTLTRSQQKRQKPERGRVARQTLTLES
jgi:hypothetical protein